MQTNVGSAISGPAYGTLNSRRGGPLDRGGAAGGGGGGAASRDTSGGGSDRAGGSLTGGSLTGGSVGTGSSATGGNSSSGDMGYKTGTWGRRQRNTSNGELAVFELLYNCCISLPYTNDHRIHYFSVQFPWYFVISYLTWKSRQRNVEMNLVI